MVSVDVKHHVYYARQKTVRARLFEIGVSITIKLGLEETVPASSLITFRIPLPEVWLEEALSTAGTDGKGS